MEEILKTLAEHYPQFTFRPGRRFSWSPMDKVIFYIAGKQESTACWSLFHELGHALLGHSSYKSDFELVRLEVAAWVQAKEIATSFGVTINEDHIQDCLDTYRDWIYARSICPYCENKSLQQADLQHYQCFNCRGIWKVTPSRFCRAYRAIKGAKQPALVLHAFDSI